MFSSVVFTIMLKHENGIFDEILIIDFCPIQPTQKVTE